MFSIPLQVSFVSLHSCIAVLNMFSYFLSLNSWQGCWRLLLKKEAPARLSSKGDPPSQCHPTNPETGQPKGTATPRDAGHVPGPSAVPRENHAWGIQHVLWADPLWWTALVHWAPPLPRPTAFSRALGFWRAVHVTGYVTFRRVCFYARLGSLPDGKDALPSQCLK